MLVTLLLMEELFQITYTTTWKRIIHYMSNQRLMIQDFYK